MESAAFVGFIIVAVYFVCIWEIVEEVQVVGKLKAEVNKLCKERDEAVADVHAVYKERTTNIIKRYITTNVKVGDVFYYAGFREDGDTLEFRKLDGKYVVCFSHRTKREVSYDLYEFLVAVEE